MPLILLFASFAPIRFSRWRPALFLSIRSRSQTLSPPDTSSSLLTRPLRLFRSGWLSCTFLYWNPPHALPVPAPAFQKHPLPLSARDARPFPLPLFPIACAPLSRYLLQHPDAPSAPLPLWLPPYILSNWNPLHARPAPSPALQKHTLRPSALEARMFPLCLLSICCTCFR